MSVKRSHSGAAASEGQRSGTVRDDSVRAVSAYPRSGYVCSSHPPILPSMLLFP